MPIVRPQRQVSLAPIPGARRSAAATPQSEGAGVEAANAQVGQSLERLGAIGLGLGVQQYTEIKRQERETANQTAGLEMGNRFSEWKNKYLYDDATGALKREGKAALGIPEEAQAEFVKVAGEIEKLAKTPEQQQMFQRMKAQEGQDLDLTTRRHTFSAMQTYGRTELKNAVINGVNEAVVKALEPKASEAALADTVAKIKATGPGLGLGPETIEQQVTEVTSAVREGVIERLLNSDKDQAAKGYFEAVKEAGQLTGDALVKMEKAVEAGTLRGESQRKADEILGKYKTYAEQLAAVKEIDDPKLKDATRERVEHEKVVKDRIELEAERDTMTNAYNILDRTPNVNRIPTATWAAFDGPTKSAMRSYAEHVAKGAPVTTDLPTYYGLVQRAMDEANGVPVPEGQPRFTGENLLRYKGKLDEAEFKQLAGLQLSIASGNRSAAMKDLGGMRTSQQIVTDSLTQYGINPGDKDQTPAEAQAVATFRRALDTSVAVETQRLGKAPDNAFIQREADRILSLAVTTPGSWWNILPGGKPFNDVTTTLIKTKPADIPAAERTQVEAALRATGQVVSDATVLELWIRTKARAGAQQ